MRTDVTVAAAAAASGKTTGGEQSHFRRKTRRDGRGENVMAPFSHDVSAWATSEGTYTLDDRRPRR